MTIEFHVDGTPMPQPRTKARAMIKRLHTGRLVPVGRVYNPGDADDWKALVALAAREHAPLHEITGPVELVLEIHLPRPQALYRAKDPPQAIPHTGRGDVDNFAKVVMDVLTSLGFWRDDKQVSDLVVRKRWAAKGLKPGMDLVLTWDDEAEVVKPPKQRQARLPLDEDRPS